MFLSQLLFLNLLVPLLLSLFVWHLALGGVIVAYCMKTDSRGHPQLPSRRESYRTSFPLMCFSPGTRPIISITLHLPFRRATRKLPSRRHVTRCYCHISQWRLATEIHFQSLSLQPSDPRKCYGIFSTRQWYATPGL